MFVPLRATFEALGATVEWIAEENAINIRKVDMSDTYSYLERPDATKPYSWMFETRGTEEWVGYMDFSVCKAYQGSLWFGMAGGDPAMKSGTFKMPASDYKYLRIRMKNEGPGSTMYVFFIREDSTSWGGTKKFAITASGGDTEFKEYIVNLSENPDWKGTVTQLRIDPTGLPGNVPITADCYIDSIEFLKELPQ